MARAEKVVVVGGGPVGALAATALAKAGFRVTLVERRDDLRQHEEQELAENATDKSASKRSINLALSYRGIEALRAVGLDEAALKIAIPMHGRLIHMPDGTRRFQRYDETDVTNHINSISREDLNKLLLDAAAAQSGIEMLFGQQLLHIDKAGRLHFAKTASVGSGTYNDCAEGDLVIDDADLILGCDGAYSSVRESLTRLQSTNFSRRYISHGYKELEVRPDEKSGKYKIEPAEALSIWPRGDFMMIALPNLDYSFTCTIFAPLEELQSLSEDADIKAYFEQNFPGIIPYMPDYVDQFKRNPACRLVTSRVDPWNLGHKIVLLGDAAHAMVPFYGQGMNSGMEDVLELMETLSQHEMDITRAIPAFAVSRMPRGNAIADLSLDNYMEMRSHTASRLFLLRKRLEGWLNALFPSHWVPLYKMVAFTRIPYDEAVRREARQSSILEVSAIVSAVGLVALSSIAGLAFWSGSLNPFERTSLSGRSSGR
ncbi:Kynurenine 3-monooxygenase [Hondaea fermentalgiana]|uniref:Kynurenine 3-monooxygenase n=1 Tax=Hondaea fermentalgiana TaxID=2315210 RepID=A0A2R5GXA7_9STRA|nr:Kynurenine 3-monooxygenase [Hondaea fermentalgiana]|eukprot:GBG32584.1 Kynurenine 3-monooxygenase [Hondaea fermentalgiana]